MESRLSGQKLRDSVDPHTNTRQISSVNISLIQFYPVCLHKEMFPPLITLRQLIYIHINACSLMGGGGAVPDTAKLDQT